MLLQSLKQHYLSDLTSLSPFKYYISINADILNSQGYFSGLLQIGDFSNLCL